MKRRIKVEMTYQLAMAVGQDAANRNMRKNKRKEWNIDDWNEAARVVDALLKTKSPYLTRLP